MLGERHQLAGVGDGVAGLEHSQLMLLNREAGLGDGSAFVEASALRTDVRVDLAVTFERPSRVMAGGHFCRLCAFILYAQSRLSHHRSSRRSLAQSFTVV